MRENLVLLAICVFSLLIIVDSEPIHTKQNLQNFPFIQMQVSLIYEILKNLFTFLKYKVCTNYS